LGVVVVEAAIVVDVGKISAVDAMTGPAASKK